MRIHRIVPVTAAVMFYCGLFPAIGRGELVKRDMYVNSAGTAVSQYVYQGGRTRSSRGPGSYGYGYGYGSYGYGYGSGYAPSFGGYCGTGSSLYVRPHACAHGTTSIHGGGQAHGSYSGGGVHVHVHVR